MKLLWVSINVTEHILPQYLIGSTKDQNIIKTSSAGISVDQAANKG